jgi:hypothetical protein
MSVDERDIDEGPSEEDIERFSGDTARCPDCNAEVWDAADVCPKCFAYLGGATQSRPSAQQWFDRKMFVLIIILLIIGLFIGGLIWRPAI